MLFLIHCACKLILLETTSPLRINGVRYVCINRKVHKAAANEGNHNVSIFGVLEVSNKWGPTNQWNSHVLFFSLQISTHPNL